MKSYLITYRRRGSPELSLIELKSRLKLLLRLPYLLATCYFVNITLSHHYEEGS